MLRFSLILGVRRVGDRADSLLRGFVGSESAVLAQIHLVSHARRSHDDMRKVMHRGIVPITFLVVRYVCSRVSIVK